MDQPGQIEDEAALTGEQPDMFLTFSGGGHRAAAFALGATLGVGDAGGIPRLRAIASVSGGSLTNATLGLVKDLRFETVENLALKLRRLAYHLARAGSLNATIGSLLIWSVCISAFFTSLIYLAWNSIASDSDLPAPPGTKTWVMAGVALAVVFVVWGFLSTPGNAIGHWRMFFASGPISLFQAMLQRGFAQHRLRDLSTAPSHIICGTDLKARDHLYFSGDGIESPEYGRASRGHETTVARAVAASAAFPPVFPPIRIKSAALEFPHSTTVVDRTLVLLDGGVHDNLAAGWLAGQINLTSGPKPTFLCVDAGPVDRWKARSNRVAAYLRVIPTIQNSNALARKEWLKVLADHVDARGLVINLQETARDLEWRIGREHPRLVPQLNKEFPQGCADLGWTDSQWTKYRNENQSVKTVLSKLGRETTMSLVYHGYVLGYIAARTVLEGSAQSPIRSFADLRSMLDLQKNPELATKEPSFSAPTN